MFLVAIIKTFSCDSNLELREQAESVPASIPEFLGLIAGGKLGQDASGMLGASWDLAGAENPIDAIQAIKDIISNFNDFIDDAKKK